MTSPSWSCRRPEGHGLALRPLCGRPGRTGAVPPAPLLERRAKKGVKRRVLPHHGLGFESGGDGALGERSCP